MTSPDRPATPTDDKRLSPKRERRIVLSSVGSDDKLTTSVVFKQVCVFAVSDDKLATNWRHLSVVVSNLLRRHFVSSLSARIVRVGSERDAAGHCRGLSRCRVCWTTAFTAERCASSAPSCTGSSARRDRMDRASAIIRAAPLPAPPRKQGGPRRRVPSIRGGLRRVSRLSPHALGGGIAREGSNTHLNLPSFTGPRHRR